MPKTIMRFVNKIMLASFLVYLQGFAWADQVVASLPDDNQDNLGGVAANMATPIGFVEKVFNGMSVVLGVYMLMSAAVRYKKYRENPQESPISFVIVWVILGIILIVLPFLHHLTFLASQHTGVTFIETN